MTLAALSLHEAWRWCHTPRARRVAWTSWKRSTRGSTPRSRLGGQHARECGGGAGQAARSESLARAASPMSGSPLRAPDEPRAPTGRALVDRQNQYGAKAAIAICAGDERRRSASPSERERRRRRQQQHKQQRPGAPAMLCGARPCSGSALRVKRGSLPGRPFLGPP